MLTLKALRTEYLNNPIGIDASKPRLSWKLFSDRQHVMQDGYQVQMAADESFQTLIWDSGWVNSDDSVRVKYGGRPLKSGERVYWKVTVKAGSETAESETAYFEMGLLNMSDWQAKWIDPVAEEEDIESYQPVSCLRRSFTVKSGLRRARIYQSAHGLYEFWINGRRGTQDVFKPGFTSYYHRIQYQTYDITELLNEGENTWSVMLGDGWWRGTTGGMYRNNFGYKLQFIGQIILDYADDSSEIIVTDEQFRTARLGLRMSDMKYGEIFDARMEPENWQFNGFDDKQWKPVVQSAGKHLDHQLLIPSRSVPVREKENFVPRKLIDANGNLVLDFGQNIAGYVKMKLRHTQPGQLITLVHGEDMKDGVFNLDNFCPDIVGTDICQQIDYQAKGDEVEEYQPFFAVFGFRYVKVSGYSHSFEPDDFIGIAVYSDLEETGDFRCSNELINQLVKNSRWSQKGNFLDVPTDCPTRERSAWTGDSHVYAKTASEFMNVYPFFEKWLKDLSIEQYRDGMVANSVPVTTSLHNPDEVHRLISENKCGFIVPGIGGPDGRPGDFDGSVGWGDTAVITPYTMYLCYGDREILDNQYESAKKWVDYMIRCAKDVYEPHKDRPEYHHWTDGVRDADYLFDTRFHFGEWLEPYSEESDHEGEFDIDATKKRTDPLVATAYMYYSATLLSQMARILEKMDDQQYYEDYAKNIKRVYNKYLIKADGTIIEGRQAPYVRTLKFDLADPLIKEKVAHNLAKEVRKSGMCLNTGFLSTPFLLSVLLENGYKEEAFAVLEQTKLPSWLHPVTLGATTILEDWAGLDTHANSYNHYSYGAVCDFLFSTVCGIQPVLEQPGYKHFIIKPVIGGTLTHAEAVYESQYGEIYSSWKLTGSGTEFRFKIPVNTTAQIILPDGSQYNVGSGSYVYFNKADNSVKESVK